MQMWMARTIVALEVASIGVLAWFGANRVERSSIAHRSDILLVVALLLAIVCSGLFMKLRRRWSTRILWEWMFVGMALLGGWIYPRLLVPGLMGMVLGGICVFLPFFWINGREVRLLASWVGAAGASLLLGSSLDAVSLWVLLAGFTVYDIAATRSGESLERFLQALSKRRGVSVELRSMTGLSTRIWLSHVILPAALIARATWQEPLQGVFLLLALLIGAWYAIMRPTEGVPLRIVPWVTVWMLATDLLMSFMRGF